MNAIDTIKHEINAGDLTHEEIATVLDTTVRQVDLVWLDMINQLLKNGEPKFVLE